VSCQAVEVINDMMKDVLHKIATTSADMMKVANRKTLTERDIKRAILLLLPGDLGKLVTIYGNKSLHNYLKNKEKHRKSC